MIFCNILEILPGRNSSLPVQIALVVIGCIALIIAIKFFYDYSLEKVKQKKTVSDTGKVDKKDLKRIANKLNLSDEYFNFLLYYCKLYQIKKIPLISDTEYCIKTVFNDIYKGISGETKNLSSDEIEKRKHTLFMIVTQVEEAKRTLSVLTSTMSLTEGLPITYITEDNERHKSKIIENNKHGLCIEVAKTPSGKLIKPDTLTTIQLYFELNGGIAYMISTRVIRYQYRNGVTELVATHSNDVNFSQKRKYRRKNVTIKAVYQAVDVHKDEKANKNIFSVREKKYSGVITNISAGGCRLRVKNAIKAGQHMQISTILPTAKSISATAIIINSKKNIKEDGFILNIRFIRMNKKSQNAIFEFVYDYLSAKEFLSKEK